jgi:hypothetical protein
LARIWAVLCGIKKGWWFEWMTGENKRTLTRNFLMKNHLEINHLTKNSFFNNFFHLNKLKLSLLGWSKSNMKNCTQKTFLDINVWMQYCLCLFFVIPIGSRFNIEMSIKELTFVFSFWTHIAFLWLWIFSLIVKKESKLECSMHRISFCCCNTSLEFEFEPKNVFIAKIFTICRFCYWIFTKK